jgi:hypothetical protein
LEGIIGLGVISVRKIVVLLLLAVTLAAFASGTGLARVTRDALTPDPGPRWASERQLRAERSAPLRDGLLWTGVALKAGELVLKCGFGILCPELSVAGYALTALSAHLWVYGHTGSTEVEPVWSLPTGGFGTGYVGSGFGGGGGRGWPEDRQEGGGGRGW